MKYIIIGLGKERYAISTEVVRSVERVQAIRSIPMVDPSIKGVINLRGKVLMVKDLRAIFGLEATPMTEDHRFVIIHDVAYIVDGAYDMVDIEDANIDPLRTGNEMMKGVFKKDEQMIIVIQDQELLQVNEIDF